MLPTLFSSLYNHVVAGCYGIIHGTNSVIHLSLLGEVETCLSFRINITI